jgi:hypothetical protein
VLNAFGSVVFDKFPNDIARNLSADMGAKMCSTYHIAYGFLSLAWRYFPQTRTCLGILLHQGDELRKLAERLLNDMFAHQDIIGQPALLGRRREFAGKLAFPFCCPSDVERDPEGHGMFE